MNSATGRELEFTQTLLATPAFEKANAKAMHELLGELSSCVVRGRSADRIGKLLELVASLKENSTRQEALMTGVVDALVPPRPRGRGSSANSPTSQPSIVTRRLRLPAEPELRLRRFS